ncbi:MAG TPA: 4-phosphoerythronate dehydrogenase [Candidatus Hydrogenedentes bacterium]|nr:4-phosphoerythronate dehydrogenase [Candidatus Hydrogenedentota bacterium]
MKIVADENIPYVKEAFGCLGDVLTLPGRAMDAAAVKDADVLLVRSITKVDEHLLEGSSVRFVGTATIGEDHIDTAHLANRGIGFASAPGSNANSVGEYVMAALLVLAERFEFRLAGRTLGIVGVGNVGSRVFEKASEIGMACVPNDPPLERELEKRGLSQANEGRRPNERRDCPCFSILGWDNPDFLHPIDDILDCDIVTLHVPLTREGPDPTCHLADASFLSEMKPGAILINTSRGPVADGDALKLAMDDGQLSACVLDVWEGEPDVDVGLLERVAIATPHIAGYSFDGKVNGTRMIYEAASAFFGIEPTWDPTPLLPAPECPCLDVPGDIEDLERVLRETVLTVYDVVRDDCAMRELIAVPANERPAFYDRLRKEYPRRREFFNTRVRVVPRNSRLEQQLSGLGFQCEVT